MIHKQPLRSIGYGFIPSEFIPKGKDEYHLRNKQNRNNTAYRKLTAFEIEALVRNNNTSDDWNNFLVSDAFNPELVKNCKFFGLVRIGKLEPWYLEYHNLRMPVGLYNSTIISSDFGDNVVIDNVNYLSHYVIDNDVMVVNVNELATTSTAKFGNGIIKEGEPEQLRIWLEVCNENAGRKIIPFNGMLPGDAYMWARFRDDEKLMQRFLRFTENEFDRQRGYYGKIGARTVIKNCSIIKDVWVGTDAYLKGANKIKNVTINSSSEARTQVGEGCELVNGIIGDGCRVFYGVKAVRFFMASHSQLKYGARLINSYLGNNSTISCCEVLNSLIYPFHEQHHNNSFLCASLIEGQSNMAAGATIGSNHNSRGADGELRAGRGFWPGLCVSLKHNSRFASFTMIAKGDYPAEMDIPFPFALISQDTANNSLQVMPAYWFMYNMYALCRNAWKYQHRDQRKERVQQLETAYLAPDSVNEILQAICLLEESVGKAYFKANPAHKEPTKSAIRKKGKELLGSENTLPDQLEIRADELENGNRPVVLLKARQAYHAYLRMARYYGLDALFQHALLKGVSNFAAWKKHLPTDQTIRPWTNLGGQLMPLAALNRLRQNIRSGVIKSWNEVHQYYIEQGRQYDTDMLAHAYATLLSLGINPEDLRNREYVKVLLQELADTRTWITHSIRASREKDYQNPFRTMMYNSPDEMNQVIGALDENGFILDQQKELRAFIKILKQFSSRL
jgi:hypothetical protein